MVFSSHVFLLAFLPAVLALYYLCPRRWRNWLLLLGSLAFYSLATFQRLPLLLGLTAFAWLVGLALGRRRKKALLWLAVVGILLPLALFKYGAAQLPLGLSFYAFSCIGYVADVYCRRVQPQKNGALFALNISFFPKLVSGPITPYAMLEQQLIDRRESMTAFASGVELFVAGLGKKLLMARPMGRLFTLLLAGQGSLSGWMALLAYSLQLYFDFSGYSDMARGLGRMFGFSLPKNFNYPYTATSLTDFWRRWHMSLSAWFRDYVYIPLGGNRRGRGRMTLNLLLVWGMTGLWHGASWNFLLWGLYYGVLLTAEKLLKLPKRCPKWLRRGITLFWVGLGWALFYFQDLIALGGFLKRLFSFSPTDIGSLYAILGMLPTIAIACIAATPAGKIFALRHPKIRLVGAVVLLLLCMAALAGQGYESFLYFQF